MTVAKFLLRLPSLSFIAVAAAGAAQTTPPPVAPTLIPGLENFSLPQTGTPGPVATPTPSATPTPAPPPAPAAAASTAPPRAAPVAAPTPDPTPGEPTIAVGPPTAVATPPPAPIAIPTSVPAAAPQPAPAASFLTLAGMLSLLALAALGLGAWLFLRRRRQDAAGDWEDDGMVAPPPPVAAGAAAAAVGAGPRAMLELGFRPLRAGTNLTGAAVEYEIVVRNAGPAAATAIRLDLRLMSGAADQDAVLAALFASPIARLAAAPFDLPPGADRTLTGMVMLPHDVLAPIRVQGRALFVPVLALNALYGWDGGEGQTAGAWLVGIDRGDDRKMAPFRLDTGPRMYDTVDQRPQGRAVLR